MLRALDVAPADWAMVLDELQNLRATYDALLDDPQYLAEEEPITIKRVRQVEGAIARFLQAIAKSEN